MYPIKATDDQIAESYRRTKSVWKTAEELGMCGQSVHERLQKMGIDTSANLFTSDDMHYLAERYVIYRDAGQLQVLADEMGRTKAFICRKAGVAGLTDPKRKMPYFRKWMDMPDCVLEGIWERFKRQKDGVNAFCKKNHYGVQHFVDAMRGCFPDEYDRVVESKIPKRTRYARGRDFEYLVRGKLTKAGYFVLRSPASKSPVDLYCFRKGDLVFVQCKLHGAVHTDEWNKFLEFCASVGALPIVAMRGPNNKGVEYRLITGKKDGSPKPQPWELWNPTGGESDVEEG